MKLKLRVQDEVFRNMRNESLQYPKVENGGRLIGYIYKQKNRTIIDVRYTIDAGHNAKRTCTSFFQDGEYQFQQLIKMRAIDPGLSYLGSWHNHLCNGYPKLSSGDITTYRKTVNREDYPEPYFVAILLVPGDKADITYKVHLFEEGKEEFYEFSEGEYEVYSLKEQRSVIHLKKQREKDNLILKELFPKMNPFLRNSSIVWKGALKIKRKLCKIELIQSIQTGEWQIRTSHYKKLAVKLNRQKHLYSYRMLFAFYTKALQYNPLTAWLKK